MNCPFHYDRCASQCVEQYDRILEAIATLKEHVLSLERKMAMTKDELVVELGKVKDQVDKSKAELVGKIADLEATLNNVTPETVAALDALKASVQAVDDITPDVTP